MAEITGNETLDDYGLFQINKLTVNDNGEDPESENGESMSLFTIIGIQQVLIREQIKNKKQQEMISF